ncbi:histone deacetylase [Streptomyces sp. NPDC046939]|uniref:histone deacetylase n=1 Tax=Streptomyces sp. NPDC046939 TaxID=3155376 RepID=UPI0033C37648
MRDVPRIIDPALPGDSSPERVWYASYGSNMHLDRLAAYIQGGRPAGAARTYPGCRDTAMPAHTLPVELAGGLYFATESPVWGGGRAFYDPGMTGRVLARAHLVTARQFADIAAQEMYREPGADLDLGEAVTTGRAVVGPGRYETLVCAGRIGGAPVLTFTAPWSGDDVPWVAPSSGYLRFLATGLLAAHTWTVAEIAAYLAACPGAAGHWSRERVTALLRGETA